MKGNLFNSVKMTAPGRNMFDLTHDVKLTCNMNRLVPIMIADFVPGDTAHIAVDALVRMSPLVAPIMHRVDVTMHYFFCPNRLLWPEWEDFITGTTEEVAPYIVLDKALYDSSPLFDYLGVPDPGDESIHISAIPFAAYQKIYQDYYRDQNMESAADIDLVSGDNTGNTELFTFRYRAWEHDYFTSALPFAQKGAAVDVPLGDVVIKDDWPTSAGPFPRFETEGGVSLAGDITSGVSGAFADIENPAFPADHLGYNPAGTLEVEPTTINTLRRAYRLQEWLEKMARGGSRLFEVIRTIFGVKSPDARLQRPEYITGSKTPVVISEVMNNTSMEGELPQGNMAGRGVSVTTGKQGRYFCQEHGYIIGLMSIMPKTAYQQGVPKHFLRLDSVYDYYWPQFANIGEQEIKNVEIYAPGTEPTATFGYVPRYSEYKYIPSRVAGDFKTTLAYWHLGRIFSAQPVLNGNFVMSDADPRVFAITDPEEDKLYCHVLNKVQCVRPMPKFGTPTW